MGSKPKVQGVRSPHNSLRRENRSHGEGGDRDAYRAKETDSGHVGSAKSLQTSLREISKKAGRNKSHRFGNLYTMLTKDVLLEAIGLLNPKAAAIGIWLHVGLLSLTNFSRSTTSWGFSCGICAFIIIILLIAIRNIRLFTSTKQLFSTNYRVSRYAILIIISLQVAKHKVHENIEKGELAS